MTTTDLTSQFPASTSSPADPLGGTTRTGTGAFVPATLAAAVVVGLGTLLGLWFLPFAVALVLGAVSRLQRRRARAALGAAVLAAVLGWAVPLLVQALAGAPVGAVAGTAAALAGLPPVAAVVLVATLLIAAVQALAGVWTGRTLMPRRTPPAVADAGQS